MNQKSPAALVWIQTTNPIRVHHHAVANNFQALTNVRQVCPVKMNLIQMQVEISK